MTGNNETVLQMIKSQNVNWAKMEGTTRRMIKDLAEQFNQVHAADVKRFDEMARAINMNATRLDALIETVLTVNGVSRETFNKLCAATAEDKEKAQATRK
jgi:endonuclease III-like uncharacterized protein